MLLDMQLIITKGWEMLFGAVLFAVLQKHGCDIKSSMSRDAVDWSAVTQMVGDKMSRTLRLWTRSAMDPWNYKLFLALATCAQEIALAESKADKAAARQRGMLTAQQLVFPAVEIGWRSTFGSSSSLTNCLSCAGASCQIPLRRRSPRRGTT